MKTLFAVLAGFSVVTGCTTTSTGYAVKAPIPVTCQEPEPSRPVMPTEGLAPGVSLDLFVKAAQAEIEIREGYEGQLRTALANCKK